MSEDYIETVSEMTTKVSKQNFIIIAMIESYQFSYV